MVVSEEASRVGRRRTGHGEVLAGSRSRLLAAHARAAPFLRIHGAGDCLGLPRRRRPIRRPTPVFAALRRIAPRLLVVIPAHNEEANVGARSRAASFVVRPARFCVWVIADNCSDGTAQALEAGAEVFERTDDRPPQQGLRPGRLPRDPKNREQGRGRRPSLRRRRRHRGRRRHRDRPRLLSSIARAWPRAPTGSSAITPCGIPTPRGGPA